MQLVAATCRVWAIRRALRADDVGRPGGPELRGGRRGADRNVSKKRNAIESSYRQACGADRESDGGIHRPVREEAVALWRLPAALPEGPRRDEEGARVAGSVHAGSAVGVALPSAASELSALWRPGGGLSVGRTLGASQHGIGPRGGQPGSGGELANHSTAVRPELEECGHDCEASGAIRAEASSAAAGPQDWNRRSEPAQRAGVFNGGLRSGAAGSAVGRGRPDGGSSEE